MRPRRNVELKARDPDPEATLAAALRAGAQDHGVLHQRDTYFAAREGRLKLRVQPDGAQLIAYARADEATARTSSYHLIDVPDPDALRTALEGALGTVVDVVKDRRLLLWRAVRVHLDEVEGLGAWMELEAVAPEDSDLSEEHRDLAELRDALGLTDDRVVAEGYAQMLLAARHASASARDACASASASASARDACASASASARDALVAAAREAMGHAHAPYSSFPVGAALRDEQGRIHAGANVENGAFPQGQCAEASAIGALVTAGGTRIAEVAVMADATLVTPCGGCRQRLSEFAAPETPVHLCGPEGVRRTLTLADLLPHAFVL